MEQRFIQKSPRIYGKVIRFIPVMLMVALMVPLFAFASGSPMPVSVYEPYRIKRNLPYIFIDNQKEYYSYLLGDKLDPISFYMAYRYFQDKPLNPKQISNLETIFKSNGNYAGGNDPSYWESEKYFEDWKKERDTVMHDNFGYGQEANSNDYRYSNNNVVLGSEICPFGTFENATKLLREKKKTLNNDDLKTWIQNQDKIFLNCFEIWTSWRDRTWGNDRPPVTCDDQKLQGLLPPDEKSQKGFWSRVKSFFGFGKKKQEIALPSSGSYVMPFSSRGLAELQQDEEMQNALYYYYKSKKEYLCSNIPQDLFKKIADGDGPYQANATLAFVRTLLRGSSENPVSILARINGYLSRKDLASVKDAFQIEKEKILASLFDEKEFIESQKSLENPSLDLIHDVAIFQQQYLLFVKNNKDVLANVSELAKYSELVRYVYYWNFDKTDGQYISRIESEYNKSEMKNLWLTLLLKNSASKYNDLGSNVSRNSKLYYPVLYYAYRNLLEMNKVGTVNLVKTQLSSSMPATAYNYLVDLVMKNAGTMNEAIQSMDRKSVYIKALDTIDYGYTKSENKTLESLWDQSGWRDEKTGKVYYYRFENKDVETPIDDDLLTFINLGLPIDWLYSNPALRQQYKEKIFTRAFLLNRKNIYLPLLAEIKDDNPILAQAANTSNEKTQSFLIAYAILKNLNNGKEDKYGITIHNENFNYRSNTDDWDGVCNYCREDYVYESDKDKTEKQLFTENKKTELFNKYLTDKEIKSNIQEKDKLFYGSLVEMFAEPVLAYRDLYPGDGRIPEALFLIIEKVRGWHSRYDSDWTLKVFQTLQYKYPNSKWAKEMTVYR